MTRVAIFATWDDVPHLSEEAKAGLLGSYQPHERDARTKGVPSLGAGAIYPVPEGDITCAPFEFPAYYKHVYGLDVGWNRTAAIWAALDTETDVAYLYSEHYRGQAEPAIHAQAIKSRGDWIPGVIDPASRGRSQKDGEQLLWQYQECGLTNLTKALNGVDSGIYSMWSRLSTGRLKVFSTLQNWLGEYRIYRRDEKGAIVKANDHLMDATRYLCMSGLQIASFRPPDQWAPRLGLKGQNQHKIEYDPLAREKALPGGGHQVEYNPLARGR
jgi:terminase large subunit-like protein